MTCKELLVAEELTLSISCPRLDSRGAYHDSKSSIALNSGYNSVSDSQWGCTLSRYQSQLSISLRLVEYPSFRPRPAFKYLHCIPRDRFGSGAEYPVHELSERDKNGQFELITIQERYAFSSKDPTCYAFELVLSRTKSLSSARDREVPTPPLSDDHDHPDVADHNAFKALFPRKYEDMVTLLSDPGSVNVAFVFTIHSFQRRIALWAHRAMLEKYPRFLELFKIAPMDDGEFHSALIPVEGISLATFCVLLKYIYTEDLDLKVDPNQFLLCDTDLLQMHAELSSSSCSNATPLASPSTSAVLTKTLKDYNAAQFFALWEVKDKVTWSDLLLAADRFEISKLRELCLKNLMALVDKDNAVEILFGVGVCFKEEIRDPVMRYISDNLNDVFSVHTMDPFKRFAGHEGCHEVMLELLRLSRKE